MLAFYQTLPCTNLYLAVAWYRIGVPLLVIKLRNASIS